MGFKLWRMNQGRQQDTAMSRQSDTTTNKVYLEGQLTAELELNVSSMKALYDYPDNLSLKIRHLHIRAIQQDAVVLYIESAADAKTVERNIIKPCMEIESPNNEPPDTIEYIKEHLVPSLSIKQANTFKELNEELLHGNTVLLLTGSDQALIAETQGFKYRSISSPQVEQSIKGPKEAFIESAEANRSMIRKYLRDSDLQCESVKFGKHQTKTLYLMYMRNIANEQIVDRVRKRIENVRNDIPQNLYMLAQMIEARPYSLLPSTLLTERPDRVAAFLQEGHVAVIMENSPVAMVAPITFWGLFHAAEDQYNRFPSGNFMRLIRLFAILVTMLVPSVYVAISTFHVEMLPTDLMLAISAARERVPFPVIVEIIFMELAFELIRESGIRVPAPIGSTIGIVGALVLGQAAVDANLVSPILVIIVALTGLASFIVPDTAVNFAIRLQRFIFIVFAAWFGFFGLALYMSFVISYLVSFKSFGVPYLAPMAPSLSSSKDLILRPPLRKMWLRSAYLSPKDPSKKDKPEGN